MGTGDGPVSCGGVTIKGEELRQALAMVTAYTLDGEERARYVLAHSEASREALSMALAVIAATLVRVTSDIGPDSVEEVLGSIGDILMHMELGEQE
jgi:hypothetical protein